MHEPQPARGVAERAVVDQDAVAADTRHIVHFYEDEGVFCDNVAHFIETGLAAGEPVFVVATPAHRDALRARIASRPIGVDEPGAPDRIVWLDARATLARFMVDGMPDWTLFNDLFGGLLEPLRRRSPHGVVRVYGEMVDVLWRDGNKQAALKLEGLWNDLASRYSFSLLCAYLMGNFYRSSDADSFRQICRAHSRVSTSTRAAAAAPAPNVEASREDDRELSALQQRAGALQSELEHRKELELALREALMREKAARKEAERSVRYNEMFAGMLGHDLRNPLSAITTGANYIARLNANQKSTRAATRILSSAERMGRMIDQLLDFTRIRVGGGIALAPTRLDLEDVCCKVKDELEAAHPDRTIVVESRGDVCGEWDHDRLQQVLSNLVANALHHGSEGCPIVIRLDGGDPDHVEVAVHNDGVVLPEVLPILFEPFRGTTRYQRTRGLGLGLFITQQIVAAHGGTIDVASDASNGTTFRLRLPRATAALPVEAPPVAVPR